MAVLGKNIRILIIEDNPGDYVLIEEYLLTEAEHPDIHHAETLTEATEKLQNGDLFDAILLDLTLPDADGEALVKRIADLTENTPVIVLTGYENKDFGLKTLSMGISDYLLKDELNPFLLAKSISYSIERNRINRSLRQSEKQYRDLFNLSPLPKWVFDSETLRFLDVNQMAIEHYGYSEEEFLSMTIKDIRPKEDIPILEEALEQDGESRSGVYRHQKKDGSIIQVDLQSTPINYNGLEARMVVADDITEQLEAERALAVSEQRFKSLVQDGSDLITIIDPDGTYKYVAPTSESVLGIPAEEFVGTNVFDYIHEDDHERIARVLSALDKQDRIEVAPFQLRDAEGNWRWIETIVTNMLDNPAVEGYVANSRDVTESIERQKKLRKSVDRYDIVSKATSDTIWDLNLEDDTIQYNQNIYNMFGYDKDEVKEDGQWWRDRIHPEDRTKVLEQLDYVLSADTDRFQMQYRFESADGSYKNIYDRAFIVTDDDDTPIRIIGAMQDVTQQKQEQEWLKLFESAIATTNESVAIIEAEPNELPGRKIRYVNEAFKEMSGYSEDEAVGQTLAILNGPETSKEKRRQLEESMQQWQACEVELINYKKNGNKFWIHVSMAPVQNADGSYSHWVCIGRDVTEQKQKETQLRESLKEKETLLLEIHHRVKNNLAVVSGMVQLQAYEEEDQRIRQKLYDSVTRIQTMGSIHELLYQSESFTKLDFNENIKKLVSEITETFQTELDLDTIFNLEKVHLNINQAIPCSLIVNEVITNILKHAFTEKDEGRMTIDLSSENEMLHLKIKDNGKGLPKDFNASTKEHSLGLKLIQTLASQLGADYSYHSYDQGTEFSLSFKKADVKGIGSAHLN